MKYYLNELQLMVEHLGQHFLLTLQTLYFWQTAHIDSHHLYSDFLNIEKEILYCNLYFKTFFVRKKSLFIVNKVLYFKVEYFYSHLYLYQWLNYNSFNYTLQMNLQYSTLHNQHRFFMCILHLFFHEQRQIWWLGCDIVIYQSMCWKTVFWRSCANRGIDVSLQTKIFVELLHEISYTWRESWLAERSFTVVKKLFQMILPLSWIKMIPKTFLHIDAFSLFFFLNTKMFHKLYFSISKELKTLMHECMNMKHFGSS